MTRTLAVVALALAGVGLGALSAGSGAETPHSLLIWDNAARLSLPLWLKAWLGVLALTFAASLLFVRRQVGARWAAGGFAASHLLLMGVGLFDLAVIRTGLVSLSHVVAWAPALYVLMGELPSSQGSRYGLWCRALVAIIAIALLFDVRDAAMYLYYQAAGHPELSA